MLPTFNIRKRISRSANVDLEDVLKIKSTLSGLGHYKIPKWGITPYPDQDLFRAVEDFQKKNNLKVDGVLNPGGPTEKKINKTLTWSQIPNDVSPYLLASLPEEERPEKPQTQNRDTKDTRLAAGLGLYPLILGGSRIAKEAFRLYGAAEAARRAGEMAKKNKASSNTERTSITPPQPPVPPSEPPKEKDKLQQNEKFPADQPKITTAHENIPLKIDDDFEAYPELDEEMKNFGSIMERKGNEEIRQTNTDVMGVLEEVGAEEDFPIAHTGGARDQEGNEIKETLLRAPGEIKSTKGGSWLDGTGTTEDGINIHVNTYDTRADGVTPTTREHKAAVRIMRNKSSGDVFVMIPKPKKGEKLNLVKLKEFLRPVVRELKSQSAKPKDTNRWRQWDKK